MSHRYHRRVTWWMRRAVRSSLLVALTSASFVVGVWAAILVSIVTWIGFVGVGLVVVAFWRRQILIVPCAVIGGFLIGIGYGTSVVGDRAVYEVFINRQIVVSGKVKEDPSKNDSGNLSLQLDDILIDDRKLTGVVFASVPMNDRIKRGDIVTLSGIFQEGFGSFVGSVGRASVVSISRPYPGDIGRRVRDWFADEVRQAIPDPQASLGIGFLTGQKSALPDDLSNALQIVGLTHIVVASGYNLTMLVRMSRRLFVRVSKYLSALSSGAMIVAFMAVTGLSPSMTRAGLVSGLSLLAWYYGRAFHPLVLLPFAAMITIFIQPSYVWGDLGWQLSFAAFAGVMILGPLLQRYFFGTKEPSVVRQILGETIAAHLVTIPIIALSFGTISHVAIIANILVVPFVPLAMLLTFIVGICSIVNLPGLEIIALPAEWLLGYMTQVASYLAELRWAQSELTIPAWGWLIYVGGIIAACFWMWRATRYDLRQSNAII